MMLSTRVGAIELHGDTVRLAIINGGSGAPSVLELHTATADYENPEVRNEAMITAIKACTSKVKNKPTLYVLVIQSQHCLARQVQVPFKGSRRVSAAVPIELEPYLAIPIEDMLIDFSVVREVDGKTDCFAICVRLESTQDQIALLKTAGVDPECVTVDVAGLCSLWQTKHRDVNGLDAVLHVREDSVTLAVVRKRNLLFYRSLPHTAATMMASPGHVIREVQNTIRAFAATSHDEAQVRALYVHGLQIDESLRSGLEERLGVPVYSENLLDGLKGIDKSLEKVKAELVPARLLSELGSQIEAQVEPPPLYPGYEFSAAIGCANSLASGTYSFDFRTGVLARPNEAKSMAARAVFSVTLLVFIAAGYFTHCYFEYKQNIARQAEISREMWKIFMESYPTSPQAKGRSVDEYVMWRETQGLIDNAQKETDIAQDDALLAMYQQPTLLDVLRELGRVLPKGAVTVTNLRMTSSGREPKIDVSGDIADSAAFTSANEELKKSEILKMDGDPVRSNKQGKQTFDMKFKR